MSSVKNVEALMADAPARIPETVGSRINGVFVDLQVFETSRLLLL